MSQGWTLTSATWGPVPAGGPLLHVIPNPLTAFPVSPQLSFFTNKAKNAKKLSLQMLIFCLTAKRAHV